MEIPLELARVLCRLDSNPEWEALRKWVDLRLGQMLNQFKLVQDQAQAGHLATQVKGGLLELEAVLMLPQEARKECEHAAKVAEFRDRK